MSTARPDIPDVRFRDGWLCWQDTDGRWWQISTFAPELGAYTSSEAANTHATRLVPTIPMP